MQVFDGLLHDQVFFRADLLEVNPGKLRIDERNLLVLVVGDALFLFGRERSWKRERRYGNADQGDLIGVMFHGEPVCVECKDTKMPNYRKHWRELKVEMANMDTPYGVLIQHRRGVGVKSLKGMARQMAVFDIGTLERFLATHMGHVLGPDYRIRRELANRLRGESRPVPSNPMLVWMPLEYPRIFHQRFYVL